MYLDQIKSRTVERRQAQERREKRKTKRRPFFPSRGAAPGRFVFRRHMSLHDAPASVFRLRQPYRNISSISSASSAEEQRLRTAVNVAHPRSCERAGVHPSYTIQPYPLRRPIRELPRPHPQAAFQLPIRGCQHRLPWEHVRLLHLIRCGPIPCDDSWSDFPLLAYSEPGVQGKFWNMHIQTLFLSRTYSQNPNSFAKHRLEFHLDNDMRFLRHTKGTGS